jgi:hypothetical protein
VVRVLAIINCAKPETSFQMLQVPAIGSPLPLKEAVLALVPVLPLLGGREGLGATGAAKA